MSAGVAVLARFEAHWIGLRDRETECSDDVAGASALDSLRTGCGPAWLGRVSGGHEIAGSNPATPTE